MQFISQTIAGLFSQKIQFTIPVYQRAYSWRQDNWVVFLQDLIDQSRRENAYSIGNLLLEIIEKDARYEIIDGQQRLTTLIIFMRCLIDALKSKNAAKEVIDELEEDFIIRNGLKKLRPVDYDQSCFDTIIVDNNSSFTPSKESQKNMCEAKAFFAKELANKSLDELDALKKTVLKTQVNRLELEGKTESALMFELQNNRGKDLTNLEKLKSFFMYEVYVDSPQDLTASNVEDVSNYFKDIYTAAFDITGLDEDSVLIYHCNAYLHAAFGYKNLDNIKKEEKGKENKISWIKNFSLELTTTFKNLKKLQNVKSPYHRKLLKMNKRATIPYFVYPFLIKGYKFFGDDAGKMDILFHIMEILAFRYHLISSRADIDSRLSEIIRDFDGDLVKLRDNLDKKLNDAYYWGEDKMNTILKGYMYQNPALHYLLWEYEDSLQSKGYSIGAIEIKDEEIEHISPQTPTDGTKLASGYDVTAENLYTEDFIRDELNCIGNLMLISKSHNCSIGNSPFADKLNSYNSNPLFKQQAEISTFLTNGVIEWKKTEIEKRKKQIVDFAAKRWSFASVVIE